MWWSKKEYFIEAVFTSACNKGVPSIRYYSEDGRYDDGNPGFSSYFKAWAVMKLTEHLSDPAIKFKVISKDELNIKDILE